MERFDPYYHWFGIPPKDQPPNAYRLLAVERFESDPNVIEAAAEQRMLLLRTRQTGEHAADSQRLLNEITQAVRLLLDPARKQAYDDQLRRSSLPPVARTMASIAPISLQDPALPIIRPASSVRPARRRHRATATPIIALGGVALALLLLLVVAGGMWNRLETERAVARAAAQTHRTLRVPTEKPSSSKRRAEADAPLFVPAQPLETAIAGQFAEIVEQAVEEHQAVETPPSEPEPSSAASKPEISEAPGPADGTKRRVLTASDLKFRGAFKLPQQALGHSTGYAAGCLALRRVEGRVRLFCDTHVHSGGLVYEVAAPQPTNQPPYPIAEIAHEWGDIYQGRKRKASGESYELNEWIPTTSLRWDEAGQRLWWTYGEKYNTENQTAPTFGATQIKGDKAIAEGPWRLDAPQSWQRGGTLEIPPWFAKRYTNGRRLGVGFGGYYSIFEGGSYGPTLLAAADPIKSGEGKTPEHSVLLAYPSPNYCVRNPNYKHEEESWLGRNPEGDKGTWNATDEIGGEIGAAGAVWIETPKVHGLLLFASLGTGRITYSDGGVQSEDRENAVYIYSPHALGESFKKGEPSWATIPKHAPFKNDAPDLSGRAAGTAFDPTENRLYVLWTYAYAEGEERYPAVVVYDIPH